MDNTLDFGLDFPLQELFFCGHCGRTNTTLIKSFDLRRFLCSDASQCLELVRRQRALRLQGEVSVGPPKALDLREAKPVPENRQTAKVTA